MYGHGTLGSLFLLRVCISGQMSAIKVLRVCGCFFLYLTDWCCRNLGKCINVLDFFELIDLHNSFFAVDTAEIMPFSISPSSCESPLPPLPYLNLPPPLQLPISNWSSADMLLLQAVQVPLGAWIVAESPLINLLLGIISDLIILKHVELFVRGWSVWKRTASCPSFFRRRTAPSPHP